MQLVVELGPSLLQQQSETSPQFNVSDFFSGILQFMAAFRLQSTQNSTRLYIALPQGAYLLHPMDQS